ncbi:unnamed protein product [Musa acuminata subsp. malaccensis]|uniref:(wild Malaysian banana) hypothetical protein n=1 Tax=Musa acuminata subsp. malaccensis TaxID=214687 RepID=A0A804J2K9_MUSAM|nr:unnamed protein product [Musa acuminata subsp. malaccensis]
MNASEGSMDVRLAATRALYNALGFAQANFSNDMERDYITRVVCEATLSTEVKIRQAAFECLVAISSTYYNKLASYMQDIFNITAKAVREDDEPVALQAIEFWNSISLPALVPMLLETLLKQEEDQDQDEGSWNLAMAGGTCLGLVARTVGDDIVPLTQITMSRTLPHGHLEEYEFLHGSTVQTHVITHGNCHQILIVLLQSMKDVPNVSQGYEDATSVSPLSPFFQDIVHALLNVTHREDAG